MEQVSLSVRSLAEKPAKTRIKLPEEPIDREAFGPRVLGSTGRAENLTPSRLGRFLAGALDGAPHEQAELLLEIEDRDGHLVSLLNTRRLALAGLKWTVTPASAAKADVRVAQEITSHIRQIRGWSAAIQALAGACYYGWAPVEVQWTQSPGLVRPAQLRGRPHRWFRADPEHPDTWRCLSKAEPFRGEPLVPGQWIIHEAHAKGGDQATQRALGRPAAWMWCFKSYSVKDWLIFAETYGAPIRIGRFQPGTSERDLALLWRAVQALGTDAAAMLPASANIEFAGIQNGRAGIDVYKAMVEWAERTQSKIILGQTLSSDEGQSGTQALGKVHERVRQDLLVGDAVLLGETLTQQLLAPWVAWQYGADVAVPTFAFRTEPPEDQSARAKVLVDLSNLGMEIPAQWLHNTFGVPVPEKGEPTYRRPERPTPSVSAQELPRKPLAATEEPDDNAVVDEIGDLASAALRGGRREWEALRSALALFLTRRARSVDELPGLLVEALGAAQLGEWEDGLAEALLTADLIGRVQVAQDDQPVRDWPKVPPREAADWWRERAAMSGAEWDAATEAAKRRAFGATRLSTLREAQRVQALIQQALDEGTGLNGFLESVDAHVRATGLHYLETVYRTNIATAHAVGRYRQQARPETLERRPIWQLLTVDDGRVRDEHRPMHGRAWPADHDIWRIWYPPNGYNDRCRVRALSRDEVAELGITVEDAMPEMDRVSPSGERERVPLLPDPGWAFNPALTDAPINWSAFPAAWRKALGVEE